MAALFTIKEISALDSIVGWDIITGICNHGLIDVLVGASALMAFSTLLLIIGKRILAGEPVDLMAIGREMYGKLLLFATVFMNPVTYKAFAKLYAGAVQNVYNEMFKGGINQVQWSMAELAGKINEATSMGLLDIFNPKVWATNILGGIVSLTINLAMVFYWVLASMVPLYVALVILIIPPVMSLWLLFDGMGKKVLMLLISGLMMMFFIGVTMTMMGGELHYYAMSEMVAEGNALVLMIIGSVVIAMALSMPMIMSYIFTNGIFDAVQAVLCFISLLTGAGTAVSVKMIALNWIKRRVTKLSG